MQLVPLRQSSPDDLAGVFAEQSTLWDQQLSWDYWPTLGVVKSYVRSGALPGFALRTDDGTPIGYSYFVIDRPVGFLGDVFVRQAYADKENYRCLIDETTSFMGGLPAVNRIESQVFPLNFAFHPIFESLGYRTVERHFLVANLAELSMDELLEPPVPGCHIRSWQDGMVRAGANVIYDSYVDSPDLCLCRDYQSPGGCLRFLRNIVENPACGSFRGKETLFALDAADRTCGILVATRIRRDTGMIPQLSICRDWQGKGLGSFLLKTFMKRAKQDGVRQIALSVSASNTRAFRLYTRLGFQIRKNFHAFIWERPPKNRS